VNLGSPLVLAMVVRRFHIFGALRSAMHKTLSSPMWVWLAFLLADRHPISDRTWASDLIR